MLLSDVFEIWPCDHSKQETFNTNLTRLQTEHANCNMRQHFCRPTCGSTLSRQRQSFMDNNLRLSLWQHK